MSRPSPFRPPPPVEPPAVSAEMALAYQRYWRFNLRLIAGLLTLGGLVTFALPFAARELNEISFAGFRLPFYFGAQGAILIYLALVVSYIVLMQRADRILRQHADAPANGKPQPSTS
ncbi:DUF4212 domain-containing protein [Paraburkholderia hayleyella]|uniref:DUF4212 domain-containing protein n=1 Tax=Paraburkholderia hayleyella TaxID=2152889 RepID=UPI001290C216|nr:DUF4212 domain-containing protein [Paraburkholderia hayleyella]